MEWTTSDRIFNNAIHAGICPQAAQALNEVPDIELQEALSNPLFKNRNALYGSVNVFTMAADKQETPLVLHIGDLEVPKDLCESFADRVPKRPCNAPALKTLVPRPPKQDIPYFRSNYEDLAGDSPLSKPQPVKEYARWTRVPGSNMIFTTNHQYRAGQQEDRAHALHCIDPNSSSMLDLSSVGESIGVRQQDETSGFRLKAKNISSVKVEGGPATRCWACQNYYDKHLESIIMNPNIYLNIQQTFFFDAGDFFNVQKQVLLDLAHASKDDLSALESISPNPTICYLNSAPIPQQFSDNSEPVVMFQPPSTAKADLGGQSSPQNEYNFRSFINQRVVDFLGDELQSLNTGILHLALEIAVLFFTLFSLDEIKVYAEGAVNDFEAKRLLYWTLQFIMKEISERLVILCHVVNGSGPEIDPEEVHCALLLIHRLTQGRKGKTKIVSGCLNSLTKYLKQLEERREYAERAFERATETHTACNCSSRGTHAAQRRQLIRNHGKLEPVLTLSYSTANPGTTMLPQGFSDCRSVIDILSRSRKIAEGAPFTGKKYQNNNSEHHSTSYESNFPLALREEDFLFPEYQADAHSASEPPPLTNRSSSVDELYEATSDPYDHVWASAWSVMGIEQPACTNEVNAASTYKRFGSLEPGNLASFNAIRDQSDFNFYLDFGIEDNTNVYMVENVPLSN